ncbi:hypothetical protein [Rhodococcus marinonascens]|uniref:hypothetical protein n=1 Tax=Rhodococcus marinonascens TaxID=38311 RepID=UPI00093531F9|nr:hypothetical protein [Rhodococcus marinonascens]
MTTTIEELDQAADDLQAKADRARTNAQKAVQAARDAEAEAERRRTEAVHAFETRRQSDYRKEFGGRIAATREKFADAVRNDGDVFGAWAQYRRTRVTVAAEFQAFARHHAEIHDAKIDTIHACVCDLNVRSSQLTCTPKSERGPRWRAEVAGWNADTAAHLGTDRAPDDAPQTIYLPDDLPTRKLGRLSGLGGPDPDADSDFLTAFNRIVRDLEAEAVAEHRAQRARDLDAHLGNAAA